MELRIERKWTTDKSTIGELYINDKLQCYTLEDVVRQYPNKIPHETAIWEGVYDVIIDKSDRFGRFMPHVLNVKLFDGIRIHWGNTAVNTEGCILVGEYRSNNAIGNSRIAFDKLFTILQTTLARKETVRLTVSNQIEVMQPIGT